MTLETHVSNQAFVEGWDCAEIRRSRSSLGVKRSLARHHPHSCCCRDFPLLAGMELHGFGVRGQLQQYLVWVAMLTRFRTNVPKISESRDYTSHHVYIAIYLHRSATLWYSTPASAGSEGGGVFRCDTPRPTASTTMLPPM